LQTVDQGKIWLVFGGTVFSMAGALSLLLTDILFLPSAPSVDRPFFDRLWFSTSPHIFISCTVFPMLFAGLAIYRWLFAGSKLFGGWVKVAIASWFSLVINPVIWFLVISSHFLFGLVAIMLFLMVGFAISVVWRAKNA
jgi:hypothetical protein